MTLGDSNTDIEGSVAKILDGSTSAPSLTFLNDQDTGFYRSGADTFGVATGGTKAIEFAGSNVEIPNGDLTVNGNVAADNNTDSTLNVVMDSGSTTTQYINFRFKDQGTNRWNLRKTDSNDLQIRDEANGLNLFEVQPAGPVSILSTNLKVPNGYLTVNNTQYTSNSINSSQSDFFLNTGGSGSGAIHLNDSPSSQKILTAHEGGNVTIPNGDLSIPGGDSLTVNQGSTFSVSGALGSIRFRSWASGDELRTGGNGGDQWAVRDMANNQPIVRFEEGGNVSVPNGDLTIGGGIEVSSTHIGRRAGDSQEIAFYGTQTDIVMRVDDGSGARIDSLHAKEGGNVEIPNGHLDVAEGVENQQRGAPTTSELASGATMVYTSDGTDAGSAGDLMYAVNDGGTILTSIIAQRSNAT